MGNKDTSYKEQSAEWLTAGKMDKLGQVSDSADAGAYEEGCGRAEALRREAKERDQAEEQLRFQSLILGQVNDAVISVDDERRITYFNKAAERQYGVSAEEVIGRSIREVLEYRWVRPEDEEEAGEALTREGVWRGENLHVRRDGMTLRVESVVSALKDECGVRSGFLAVIRDVTSRRRAEEALRASEERLRVLIESVPDYAIFTLDAEGRIQSWNSGAERVFGFTEEEAIGQHAEILFAPEDRARGIPAQKMLRAREAGRAEDERWHTSKHGTRFYLSGVLTPLRDSTGALTGYAKIARDLTERQRLEDELRRAHDELEQRVRDRTQELAAANESLKREVSERRTAEEHIKSLLKQLVTVQEEERCRIARELHDTLGQQLAALRLGLGLFRSKADVQAELREDAERMQWIFDRLDSDLNFLAWELRPAGLAELGLEVALENFVREWSEHFRIAADYQSFGLNDAHLSPEVETNIYRILQEALQNVHKHAKADRVSVMLQRHLDHAVLIIEDDGKGYHADEEMAADNKGMGIVNMRERAALIGGSLQIESSPGGGTTILVRVPLAGSDRE